jgi:hypothetical protein
VNEAYEALDPKVRDVIAQINDDYTGLYEIVWSFRSNFLPDAPEKEIIPIAREAVTAVLENGYARLVWYRVEPPLIPREITQAEAEKVLAAADSWRPPESWGLEFPNLEVTDAGQRIWRLPGVNQ